MSRSSNHAPFEPLGGHLKYLREQNHQSRAEVSGAVEIEETMLERIEEGLVRPPEDVLLLLISYFGMKDQEAIQLWELAGYDGDMPDQIRAEEAASPAGSMKNNIVMLLAMDVRTVYSDGIEVGINPAGVTLNFTQSTGIDKVAPVARLGMSHQQAEMVIKTLQQALLRARYQNGPRMLPPSDTSGKP